MKKNERKRKRKMIGKEVKKLKKKKKKNVWKGIKEMPEKNWIEGKEECFERGIKNA